MRDGTMGALLLRTRARQPYRGLSRNPVLQPGEGPPPRVFLKCPLPLLRDLQMAGHPNPQVLDQQRRPKPSESRPSIFLRLGRGL